MVAAAVSVAGVEEAVDDCVFVCEEKKPLRVHVETTYWEDLVGQVEFPECPLVRFVRILVELTENAVGLVEGEQHFFYRIWHRVALQSHNECLASCRLRLCGEGKSGLVPRVFEIVITEKWLLEIGGWKVMKEARSAYNAGAVLEAGYSAGLLKGTVRSKGKELVTGLHIRGRTDIENYCKCYDARRMGIICHHAIAAGLFVALGPKQGSYASGSSRAGGAPRSGRRRGEGGDRGAEAPALRIEFSPSWVAALRKGKIAGTVVASAEDRPPDAADRRLFVWLQKHGLGTALPAHLTLPPALVPGFLQAAAGHKELVSSAADTETSRLLGVGNHPARLPATVSREGDAFTIELDLCAQTEALTLGEQATPARFLLSWGDILRVFPAPVFPASDPDFLRDLLDGWPVERDLSWVLEHLAALSECLHFPEGSALDALQLVPGDAQFELHIEGSLNFLEAELFARYGKLALQVGEPGRDGYFPAEDPAGSHRFLVRNLPAEQQAEESLLQNFGFVKKQGKLTIKGEQKILRFLSSGVPRLQRAWKVRLGARISTIVGRYEPISMRAAPLGSLEGGWFSFSVDFVTGAGTRIPQAEIARLLRSGQPKLSLPGGGFGLIDLDAADALQATLVDAGIEQGEEGGSARVSADALGFLAGSLAELGSEVVGEFPAAFEEPATAELEAKLPQLFPLLRSYQVEGLVWLIGRLSGSGGSGGGAVLADEMGLGKTIQALAALEYLKITGGVVDPVLIVCPTSLLENWRLEAERFTPGLHAHIYHGPERDAGQLVRHDLTITSYGIVARDSLEIGARRWGAVVLDEASLIRNPDAQVSKAVHCLESRCRLALTGTPVENRPSDLWSLMGFVRPGYLGARKDFIERFEKPLTSALGSDRGQVAARLRRKIAPFILRRLKSEVATDLPQKIERVLPVTLHPRQAEVYQRILQEGLNRAEDERKKGGQGAARMCLLTTLLRLRQVCCDLRLLGLEDGVSKELESAKLEALKDLLLEAFEGGHRCLVFSQFAAMLRILRDELKAGGMPSCYLDGSSQDRAEQVALFQSTPEIPVFLISLKAGGYGLNLTAADTVIHFDPWWNPAVEAQATDRAHRIGQSRSVNVYKLITTGTVEENILRLQKKKRDILDAALDDEAPLMSGLGDDELEVMLNGEL